MATLLLQTFLVISCFSIAVTAGPPQITISPENLIVPVGGKAQFTCSAIGASSYTWLSGDTAPETSRWKAEGNLLVLEDVRSDDTNVITCKAEKDDSIAVVSANLTIIDSPTTDTPCASSSSILTSGVDPEPVSEPRWKTTRYKPCSATCEGFNVREVTCERLYSDELYRQVDTDECMQHALLPRPQSHRPCGRECPGLEYTYVIVKRGHCNATCGSQGFQWLTTQCRRKVDKTNVDDIFCAGLYKPGDFFRECAFEGGSCSAARWHVGSYGHCLATCQGFQTRRVRCIRRDKRGRLHAVDPLVCEKEDPRPQPSTIRPCGTECKDHKFKFGRYRGPCTATCGYSGVRRLYFPCFSKSNGSVVSMEACAGLGRPPEGIQQPCNRVECPASDRGSCRVSHAWKTLSVRGCTSATPILVPVCQGTCSAGCSAGLSSSRCTSTKETTYRGLFRCPKRHGVRKEQSAGYKSHQRHSRSVAVFLLPYQGPVTCGCARE